MQSQRSFPYSALTWLVLVAVGLIIALSLVLLLNRSRFPSQDAMALSSPTAITTRSTSTPEAPAAYPPPVLTPVPVWTVLPALPRVTVAPTPTLPQPEPTLPGPIPAGARLIYAEIGQGETTLWKASAANPNHRQRLAALTHAPGWDVTGVVSPKGDKVAYYRIPPDGGDASGRRHDGELWVMEVDGTHALRLADHVSGLVGWAPSGSILTYFHASDEPDRLADGPRIQIYTAPAEGGESKLLLADEGHYVQPVGWSADEVWFYYAQIPQPGRYELWRVNAADGSTQLQLSLPSRSAAMPYLLPDGRHVTILVQEDTERKYMMLSLDGTEERVLARSPISDRAMDQIRPAWSRDGQEVALHVPPLGGQPAQLQRMNPHLGRQTRIVPSLDRDNETLAPRSWSPDGEWLVVDDSPGDGNATYLMRVSGGPKSRLPSSSPRVSILGWATR